MGKKKLLKPYEQYQQKEMEDYVSKVIIFVFLIVICGFTILAYRAVEQTWGLLLK